jgi:hypothetical protein
VIRIQPAVHVYRRHGTVRPLVQLAARRLVARAVDAPGTATVGAVHAAGAGGLLAGAVGEATLELQEGAGNLVLHGGLAALVVNGSDGGVVGVTGGGGRGVVGAAGRPATAGEEAASRRAGRASGVGVAGGSSHGSASSAGSERHVGGDGLG